MATGATNKDFSIELNNFRTVNTKDNPVTMKEDELPILLNFMPIGQSLYTIPGYSAVLAQTPPGTKIVRMFDFNLDGVLYMIVATSDGALYAFSPNWDGRLIAAAGTFSGNDNGPHFAQWKYSSLLIIDPKGYWYWYGYSTVTSLAVTNSAPTTGTSIEVWKGRVWIGSGRTINYSAPDDFTDFQTATSGGTIIDTYPSLRQQINTLIGAQDYLYVVGDHGTHLIYGVQVLSDGSTVFTLTDALPGTGSIFPETVLSADNAIIMMGDTGINAISATTSQLASAYLDGFYSFIDQTFKPIGFFANIYNKLVYCVLVYVTSPLDGSKQKWFMCLYEGRWFFVYFGIVGGAPSMDFTYAGQRTSSTDIKTYASYGNNIVQLFVGSSQITMKVRTKAMNYGGSFFDKQVLSVGVTLASTQPFATVFTATIKAIGNLQTGTALLSFAPTPGTWTNSAGVNVLWINSSGAEVVWYVLGSEVNLFHECEGRGKRISIDYEEADPAAPQYVLAGLMLEGQVGANK